jgi:hypothetical protein
LAVILVGVYSLAESAGLSTLASVLVTFGVLITYVFVRYVKIVRVNVPLDGDDFLKPDYFWSGPQGDFFTTTLEEGEIILGLMKVDQTEWTATKLY